MSWSIHVPPVPRAEFDAALDEARAAAQAAIAANNPDGRDQADLAVELAKRIADSGVVGGPNVRLTASLAGHGNPGHAPAAGWANDLLTVNVSQAPAGGA